MPAAIEPPCSAMVASGVLCCFACTAVSASASAATVMSPVLRFIPYPPSVLGPPNIAWSEATFHVPSVSDAVIAEAKHRRSVSRCGLEREDALPVVLHADDDP